MIKRSTSSSRLAQPGMLAHSQQNARAFTLVETLAVVVIVGILAAIAVVGYRKYIQAAKTGEAVQMLGAIKSAQEAFKAETFRYMDVSGDLSKLYPQGALEQVGTDSYAWEGGSPEDQRLNFQTLGVSSNNFVRFGYACVAGSAPQLPELYPPQVASETPDLPASPGGWWYLAEAVGDLDGDGNYSVFASSSLTAAIFSFREGE